jgi:hypothetical protein
VVAREMDIEPKMVAAKLLKGLAAEERFELAVRCLCHVARENALLEVRLSGSVDRLESMVNRAAARSWEKAIRERMEELKRDGGRKQGKRAAYKKRTT